MTEKKDIDYRKSQSLIKKRLLVRLRECEFSCPPFGPACGIDQCEWLTPL